MNNNIQISDKLKKIRTMLDLSQSEMAKESGISQRDVSQLENGAKEFIPNDFIQYLNKVGVDLNVLFSKETVEDCYPKLLPKLLPNKNYAQPNAQVNAQVMENYMNEPEPIYEKQINSIIYVNESAKAGFLQGYTQEQVMDLPQFSMPGLERGNYWAFNVDGDSMYPTLTNGDILITKRLEEVNYMRNGEIYVIHCHEGLMVKRIRKNIENQTITIISDNSYFEPDTIAVHLIKDVYHVKRAMTASLGPKNVKELEMIQLYKEIKALKDRD